MKKQRQAIKSKKSKERRIHRIEIKIILGFCVIVFIIGGLILVAQNKHFLINYINIEIENPQFVNVDEIKEYATKNITENHFYFLPKNNFLLFSKKTLENKILDNYKQLKNILITRQGLRAITITATERKPSVLWCDGEIPIQSDIEINLKIGNCYFVDKEGYIFTKTPYFYNHIYFEFYGAPFLSSYKINEENIFNQATSTNTEQTTDITWGFHPQVNLQVKEQATSTNTEQTTDITWGFHPQVNLQVKEQATSTENLENLGKNITWGFHPQVNLQVKEQATSTENLENLEKNATWGFHPQVNLQVNEQNYIGVHLLPAPLFTQIMQFINLLKEVGITSHTLSIRASNLYELSFTSGGILRFSPEQDLNRAVSNLIAAYEKKFSNEPNISSKDIDYIDIRFDNKVIFKFK